MKMEDRALPLLGEGSRTNEKAVTIQNATFRSAVLCGLVLLEYYNTIIRSGCYATRVSDRYRLGLWMHCVA
jgi:hypothetical protein